MIPLLQVHKGAAVKIILNGNQKEFQESLNLRNIIDEFCKNSAHVIAELNGEIVKSQEWHNKKLSDGDILELVNFVGGG